MEKEIWKPVPGYDGMYEVSNHGRVRSIERTVIKSNGIPYTAKERILKTGTTAGGEDRGDYLVNALCKNGKLKTFKVHRLVAKAFVQNPENKKCVNHKNGIKTDNRAINLEWVTKGENNKHAYDSGLNSMDHLTGSNHPNSKLNRKKVIEIRRLYETGRYSHESLGEKYGVSKSTIGYMLRGVTWNHV